MLTIYGKNRSAAGDFFCPNHFCVYEFSEFGLWKNHVYFTCIVRLFETLSYCLLGWASWILTS